MSVESLMERMEGGQTRLGKSGLLDRLLELQQSFQDHHDPVNAGKMGDLINKWETGEFVLAFCGHFSAGKSTMINTLMGKEILPSSPIPTSANVVKIKSGEAKAIAYFKNKAPVTFDYVSDLNQLKEYCKDGDEVVTVEIYHPNDFLVNHSCQLDTPGIDSTDAAHKVATESALHLADVVVYMMDYNHVQSEINFQFTKSLKEKGKTLFLVINQIDKHFSLELDFSSFKASVKEAFAQWGVEPDGIFYTTLKVPEHPENQLEELHDRLYELFCNKDNLLQESVQRSAFDLIQEHGQVIRTHNQEKKAKWESIIGESRLEQVEESYRSLSRKLQELAKGPQLLRAKLMKELQSLLDNANLTPFSMRDLAGKYMESCQSGFKVGFLFTAGKTKQEKENRLVAFQQEVFEQTKANLQWHLKELLQRIPREHHVSLDAAIQEEIDRLDVAITPELLASQLKQGAGVTGDAVLNYCRDLAQEIKGKYRVSALLIIEEIVRSVEAKAKAEETVLREEGREILKVQEAWEHVQRIQAEEEQYLQTLKQKLLTMEAEESEEALGERQPAPRRLWKERKIESLVKKEKVDTLVLQEAGKEAVSPFKKDYKGKLLRAASVLREAADLIQDLRGQALAAKNMRARAERLENNLFTVALFGAFSAGKSSFANAMMGEMVLPVSPNPTTATINKILPPNDKYPHGTVRVKLKSEEEMTKDVLQSLAVFRLEAKSIREAVQRLSSIRVDQILPSAKPHFTFLSAVKQGMAAMEGQYGQELLVGMEEFKELVAREEKACFVEWIELYYSCPLTDQGISLVDTPGADSINARHTGVAFDYIKNADAVLFVTYYNHAFSHADREFLQQLGRVKDTFEMDKMFFLVNAADLARSKEELQGVVEHVRENLLANGIRQPRLYPVSSQTALLARKLAAGTLAEPAQQVYKERTGVTDRLMPPEEALAFSGFETFEQDFIRFTVEELTEVAIQSAWNELKRAQTAVQSFILTAKEGEEVRRKKRIALQEEKLADLDTISACSAEREKASVGKEVEELLFYVKQRLFFKLNELFSLSFNPAVLKEEKGKDLHSVLQQCFDEFIRNQVFTLTQEMRATSLRMEKIVHQLSKRIYVETAARLHAQIAENYQPQRLEVPVFPETLDFSAASVKPLLAQFKSPKHFFEQGGRDAMRASMENWLSIPVSAFIEKAAAIMKEYYADAFEQMQTRMKEQLTEQVEEYYTGMLGALENQVDLAGLEAVLSRLKALETIR